MSDKVLIVDDSEVDRAIIHQIIKKNLPGLEVIELEDGMLTKQTIIENSVVLCILDLKMPNIDGIDIMYTLRNDPLTSEVPIIVCTGIVDTSILHEVLSLGAYDYFSKPLSKDDMRFSLPLKVRNAITLRKKTLSILQMSRTDELTGLYNRSYFKTFTQEKISKKLMSKASLVICDINGLKVVNDAYGSHVGDQFLKKLSEILKNHLPSNATCARWGGDEFVVFFENGTEKVTSKFVSNVKNECSVFNYQGISMNIAIGSEVSSKHNLHFDKLLKCAEDTMIRNKILENGSVRSDTIAAIVHTLNEKNPREEAHSRRVSELCEKMGYALGMNEANINELKVIGLLHDIGKIAIDEQILNKPGKLTKEEFEEIKRHPEIGYRILSSSKEMNSILEVIIAHHERFDGKGYPNGLMGEDIPLKARILAIADSFDAMTCQRPYRDSMSIIQAIEELKLNSGTQFDSNLIEVFISNVINIQ